MIMIGLGAVIACSGCASALKPYSPPAELRGLHKSLFVQAKMKPFDSATFELIALRSLPLTRALFEDWERYCANANAITMAATGRELTEAIQLFAVECLPLGRLEQVDGFRPADAPKP